MKYIIEGGKNFQGTIKISGAKNFSIKAIAASLLAKGQILYSNLPNNLDVHKTLSMLKSLGVRYEFNYEMKSCLVDTSSFSNYINDIENVNMVTFLIGSALLKEHKLVKFPKMKGCNLGDRLDDFHKMAFQNFNIDCYEKDGFYCLERNGPLNGSVVTLPYPSVGATETALFLGVISNGYTKIENAAIEPEIQALIALLISMGANIFFESDRSIKIYGDNNLTLPKQAYIHGDYLEVATWAVLAALSDGKIIVEGIVPELIGSFLGAYSMLGGDYERIHEDTVCFFKDHNVKPKNILLETGVYPSLRTDLQPIIAAMAALNKGNTTLIHETVYNNRLDYIEDFNKFGCDLTGFYECFGNKCRYSDHYLHSLVIKGVDKINAFGLIEAKTVRSGMACILLSSVAHGISFIEKTEIVERGYCSLFEKLKSVGVKIKTD